MQSAMLLLGMVRIHLMQNELCLLFSVIFSDYTSVPKILDRSLKHVGVFEHLCLRVLVDNL